MSYSEHYLARSCLMLSALVHLNQQSDFALKGGTAINYFYNDVPRLSIDIDLVYLPLLPRQETIVGIHESPL